VADIEDDFTAAGAQLVWVLEQDQNFQAGTADTCDLVMDALGSVDQGLCVGDGQTSPTPGTFDDSPFSVGRGFDLIVPRSTMLVAWSSSHGTPTGNENMTGADVLAEVQRIIAGL
jgi:hypothetical protein